MKATAVLSSVIVIFIMCGCATANQPWLAVLSLDCGQSTTNCIGVVLDKHWVLTTATCFSRCGIKVPLGLSAFVNIPSRAQKRFTSAMRMGNRVAATLVWQHPEFNADTYANNLALVKLDCHDHALEKLNLSSDCPAHDSQLAKPDGYIYAGKIVAIKSKDTKVKKVKCLSEKSTGTWYYHADTLQVVATSHNSDCMVTSLCEHAKQLKSFMQENEPNCTKPVPPTEITVPVQPTIGHQDLESNNTIIKPIIVLQNDTKTNLIVSSTVVTTSIISAKDTVTSVVMSTSVIVSEIPTSTMVVSSTGIPTPISTSTMTVSSTESSASTSTSMMTVFSSESPASTSMTVSPTESPASTSTSMMAVSSTESPTSMSTSKQDLTSTIASASSLTMMETTTKASTIMPTPTSSKILTSTQGPSSTVVPSNTVTKVSTSKISLSTQIPTETPTSTPTSGCVLSISNGVVYSKVIFPGFSLITYTCNQGYRFKNGISLTLGCTLGIMLLKPPPCERITCPPIEPIANGQVKVTGDGFGAVATYTCDEGFILSGGFNQRVCKDSNEWSGYVGVCKRACPFPKPIKCNDGHEIIPAIIRYGRIGESISYKENSDYVVIGKSPVCQPDSTWSTPPKCIKLCNEKEVIPNAKIIIQRNATSYTRKIVCNEGYEASGFDEQHCSKGGVWTPYFKECTKTCGQITLDGGKMKMLHLTSLLVALMECDEGFHLEPPITAITCSNGQWLPSVPRCVKDELN